MKVFHHSAFRRLDASDAGCAIDPLADQVRVAAMPRIVGGHVGVNPAQAHLAAHEVARLVQRVLRTVGSGAANLCLSHLERGTHGRIWREFESAVVPFGMVRCFVDRGDVLSGQWVIHAMLPWRPTHGFMSRDNSARCHTHSVDILQVSSVMRNSSVRCRRGLADRDLTEGQAMSERQCARDLQLQTLVIEQRERVLTARVVSPPFNYMTAQMHRDFDALTRAVDDDDTVGAVVVTGGVDKRYITHFDIADILAAAERANRPLSEHTLRRIAHGLDALTTLPGVEAALQDSPLAGMLDITRFVNVVLRIMRSPAVYIGAIGGPCGGGGLELSVAFDVRIAADDDAVGFILPELLIGLTTTVGGQRLAQLIGPARRWK